MRFRQLKELCFKTLINELLFPSPFDMLRRYMGGRTLTLGILNLESSLMKNHKTCMSPLYPPLCVMRNVEVPSMVIFIDQRLDLAWISKVMILIQRYLGLSAGLPSKWKRELWMIMCLQRILNTRYSNVTFCCYILCCFLIMGVGNWSLCGQVGIFCSYISHKWLFFFLSCLFNGIFVNCQPSFFYLSCKL